METTIASFGVIASGAEAASAEQTAYLKESYELATDAFQKASSSKSAQEVIEIQSEYLKGSTERSLSFVSKLAEHWSSVTKEAFEPASKQYGEFLEKVQTYRP